MAKLGKKKQYYEIRDTINKYPDALYYVIFGERSNGKSYSFLSYAVECFYKSGCIDSFAYIRRWKEDISMANMLQVFKSLKKNDYGINAIAELTKGEYNDVDYQRRIFSLIHKNEKGEIDKRAPNPLGHVFCLSESQRIKSTGYPDVKLIVLEEFIPERDSVYMPAEFDRFTSIVSSIVRNKDVAKIFLLGNTINAHNLYFRELGLNRAKYQAKNSIDTYIYKDDDGRELLIVSEYCDFPDKTVKKSNRYFAFNSEKNKMIRTGDWDRGLYPHLSNYYNDKDIKAMYFIIFEDEIYQCEIISLRDTDENRIILKDGEHASGNMITFTFIHQKTTPIKDPYDHIIFDCEWNANSNYRRCINQPIGKAGEIIWSYFRRNLVQFQDNTVGDNINAYLGWCVNNRS